METYRVKQVAELLDVNEETVRRWIRSGKLPAKRSSRKKGNLITENDLLEFAKSSPSYAAAIAVAIGAASASASFALPAVIAGGIAAKRYSGQSFDDADIPRGAVAKLMRESIISKQREIDKKVRKVNQLLDEAEILNKEIEEDRLMIRQYEEIIESSGLTQSIASPLKLDEATVKEGGE